MINFATVLFAEEYRSLREESDHARTTGHNTLQWTTAAYAIIFAGGLTYLGSLAEFIRMQRAALFVQAREANAVEALASLAGTVDAGLALSHPLLWETWISHPHEDPSFIDKIAVGLVGGMATLFGAATISLVVFVTQTWRVTAHWSAASHRNAVAAAIVYAAAALVVPGVLVAARATRIKRKAATAADLRGAALAASLRAAPDSSRGPRR